MDESIETINHKGYQIKIYQNDMAEDPREWENLGTMMCFHNHYTLGDKHNYSEDDFSSWRDVYDFIMKEYDPLWIIPLSLYDHSGITISHGSPSCPWDSGYVGFHFIPKAKVREEYSVKRISKKLKEEIRIRLDCELETYDNYLRGSVYGYQIEHPERDELDSCWGFYGWDHEKSGLLTDAESSVEWDIKDREEEYQKERRAHINKLKNLIKNRVPFGCRPAFDAPPLYENIY